MSTPGSELAALDFESLIGAPLIAGINAQAQAAIATVNFVKSVGFLQDPNSTIYNQSTGMPNTVTFQYQKVDEDGNKETGNVIMPFLTLVPIPTLKIDEFTVSFMAKINNVEATQLDETQKMTNDEQDQFKSYYSSSAMKVATTFQKQNKEGNVVTRDYSFNIRVRSIQDSLPAGLEKLMNLMEAGIEDKILSAPPESMSEASGIYEEDEYTDVQAETEGIPEDE